MPDYQNSKIYKLTCDNPDLFYYGATTKKYLCHRLSQHKTSKIKCMSKLLFEAGNVKIELVEKFPCNDKDELNARESFYIRNNKCVNLRIENRTVKEWREDNKEILREKQKKYKEENREHIKEYQKKYREENREHNKEKHKEYYKKNGKKNKIIKCECGCMSSTNHLARHMKTEKHKKLLIKNAEQATN